MTLVDLPGLAKLPVGDQPPDVERRVRELAMRYVSAPTCLILAVTPAGADAVTSDALHLAREADPRGERTLGVLTKCDLADGGRSGAVAAVAPLLRGEVLPLRLGYVAVVCRGGRAAGASAADGRAAEAAFFASERGAELVSCDGDGNGSGSSSSSSRGPKASSSLLSSRCGVPALAATLNRVLTDAVRGALPDLRAALEEALAERSAELVALGGGVAGGGGGGGGGSCSIEDLVGGIGSLLSSAAGTSSSAAATAAAALSRDDASPAATAARGGLLLQLLESYSSAFAGALDGSSPALPLTQLAGGARLRHVFREVFVRALDALDPCSELSDSDVRTAVKNAGGVRGTLLIPDAPFELLARRAIARLLPPALQCKELAVAELLRLADECTPPDVARFPALRGALLAAVEDFVADGALPAERMIRDLVACELAFINTDHPDFVGGSRAVAMAMERRQQMAQESAAGAAAAAAAAQAHPHPPPAAATSRRNNDIDFAGGAPALRNHHHLTTAGLASALKSPSVSGPPEGGRRRGGAANDQTNDGPDSPPAAATPPPPHQAQSIFASETNAWHLSSAAASAAASSPAAVAASRGGSGGGGGSGNGGGGGGWRFVGGWLGGGGASRAAAPAAASPSPSPVPLPASSSSSSYRNLRHQSSYATGCSSGSSNTSLPIPPATLTVSDSFPSNADCSTTSAVSEAEEVQVEVTRTLVRCYFSIVARGLADAVPKAVMHFLVRSAARGLQQHLITRLYREELFAELVAEAPGVARRREAARAAVAAAREGLAALDALPVALAAASRAGCGRGNSGGSLRSSRDEMVLGAGAGRKANPSTTTLSSSLCLKGGQRQSSSSSSSNVIPASRVGALAAAARLATAALGERGV